MNVGYEGNDLFVTQFGEEKCLPMHAYGPAVRDHYLIHFVASGSGKFYCDCTEYEVSAGQGFLILPNEETYYQASCETPWHYAWVGYRGRRANSLTQEAGLDLRRRVFAAANPEAAWDALSMMRSDARSLRLSQMAALGSLLRFMSLIAPVQDPDMPQNAARQYCEKALWFLEGRFDRNVSIQETADFVGVSRSHLYRIMMGECGCSPKEMLLQIRMRHAKRLLSETGLTLEEIARRTGFCTGAQFGAAFRGAQGMSPGAYPRRCEKQTEKNTL